MFTIIVAVDQNNGIGYKDKMAWNMPEELALFKEKTLDHTIVMGRKTFEATGILDRRKIIVVTQQKDLFVSQNVTLCFDFIKFLNEHKNSKEEIFICGGAEIYQQALPYCQKLYISQLADAYIVDTYFPNIDYTQFCINQKKQYESFTFIEYQRKENENEIC